MPLGEKLTATVLRQGLRQWPWLAAAGGGWMLFESVHGPLSSLLSLGAAGAGLWLLGGRMRPSGQQLPQSSEGWLERCEAVELLEIDELGRHQPASRLGLVAEQLGRHPAFRRAEFR